MNQINKKIMEIMEISLKNPEKVKVEYSSHRSFIEIYVYKNGYKNQVKHDIWKATQLKDAELTISALDKIIEILNNELSTNS